MSGDRAHFRISAGHPLAADILLALVLTGVAFAGLMQLWPVMDVTGAGGTRFESPDAFAVALVAVGTLSLSWQRRAPLAVLAVSGVAFFIYQSLGYLPTSMPLAPLIALYTVAASSNSLVAASASAGLLIGTVSADALYHGWATRDHDDVLFTYFLSAGAACALGYAVQLNRARTSLLEAQAGRLAYQHAAHEQHALEQELSRIARELHDIVSHHISVITALASAAQRVFDAEPQQAREALGGIEISGREALTEMRRLLGVLRPDADDGVQAPQPGLDQLPSLVAQTEQAGLSVLLCIQGEPRSLPSGIELGAYRIVQEALTNTLKHAGPSQASVVVSYQTGQLELQICDNGRGLSTDLIPGQGLIGMRQRTALLGGQLAVGPGPAGGVQVDARLPVGGERM